MSKLEVFDQTEIFKKIKKEQFISKKRAQKLQKLPIIREKKQNKTLLVDQDLKTLELMDTFINENNKKK